jgi:hypothetical protein
MTNPITPPPELIEQWRIRWGQGYPFMDVAKEIAQYGADQELEACCLELVDGIGRLHAEFPSSLAKGIRTARRPKPPSLKEQALEVVTGLEKRCDLQCDLALIRRALESQP